MSNAYKFRNPEGVYFVTAAVVGWMDVFTRNVYRDIFLDSIRFCQANKGLELFAWVLMSNHFHLIARAEKGSLLQNIMGDMKKFTSRNIISAVEKNVQESRREWMLSMFRRYGQYNANNKHYQFWQQDNHPVELWSSDVVLQKLNYIHENPVRGGWVDNAVDYPFSSARNYSGKSGLLDVSLLA